jgi:hypothetical protein
MIQRSTVKQTCKFYLFTWKDIMNLLVLSMWLTISFNVTTWKKHFATIAIENQLDLRTICYNSCNLQFKHWIGMEKMSQWEAFMFWVFLYSIYYFLISFSSNIHGWNLSSLDYYDKNVCQVNNGIPWKRLYLNVVIFWTWTCAIAASKYVVIKL